jgi:5-dehydro-2-deoxygluconokinase
MESARMNVEWPYECNRPMDIICMGRVAIDLYSEQIGSSLEDSITFRKYLGGCAGNIAVGCARLGLRSAMFSCVGADAMGLFLKQELTREGVDISLVSEDKRHLTGLVLLGVNPPDRFPLIFYRENCADMQLKPEHVNKEFFASAKSLLMTGTGLSTDSMYVTTRHAIAVARSVNTKVIFDLDYRPVLWGLTDQGDGESRYKISAAVSKVYQEILSSCDLIIGTEEEILIAGNTVELDQALAAIRALTNAPIVLKRGAKGCAIYLNSLTSPVTAHAFPIQILNVLGAGDGFMSGFLRGLLRDSSWEQCATYGNACGAIVVTKHGCAPAMPTYPEMLTFIGEYHDRSNVTASTTRENTVNTIS